MAARSGGTRRAAVVWGVVAAVAAVTYAIAFWVVLDRTDAGEPAGPLSIVVWPAAGLAVVAFAMTMVHVARRR
ncbi:hypothetical protein ICW40_16365 [Actinotalea ferrariae]|uniref:hypothetical protein n=1 Tax=Actinotalea ferrariae TaxID=1386098 RepID=UPI001C8CD976|nr:hypothetical protein [Actinotalea ferrariae]MBX9246369.1 hypothetical protein [Actinotalea ferrariae]